MVVVVEELVLCVGGGGSLCVLCGGVWYDFVGDG